MRNFEMFNTTRRAGVLLLGLFLTACYYGKQTEEITNYQITKTLSIDESRLIKNSCFGSSFIVDDFVVFIADCDSLYFHVFDKHTLDFKFKFGNQGRGPAEFDYPHPFLTNTTRLQKDDYYYFYEPNLFQVKKINFNRIMEGYIDEGAISSYYMDREMYAAMDWNQLDDNRIAAVHYDYPEGLFFIYNTENKKTNWAKYIHSFAMEDRFKTEVFYGRLVSNGETIFFASRNFDEILVFDNRGKLQKRHHFSPIDMPILSRQFTGVAYESIVYFTAVYGNIDACYFKRIAVPRTASGYRPTQTQLFEMTWDGELLNVYEMDFNPAAISICENTGYLYAVVRAEIENDSITLIKASLK